jgi:hypothetical protein
VKGLGVTGGRGISGGSGGLAATVAVAWDAYDVSGGNAWQLEQCWLVWARETCRIHKSSIVQQSGVCQLGLKACWQRSACIVQRNPLWLPGRGRQGQVAFSLVLAGLRVQPLTPGEREAGGPREGYWAVAELDACLAGSGPWLLGGWHGDPCLPRERRGELLPQQGLAVS